jgi:hypothetical protein
MRIVTTWQYQAAFVVTHVGPRRIRPKGARKAVLFCKKETKKLFLVSGSPPVQRAFHQHKVLASCAGYSATAVQSCLVLSCKKELRSHGLRPNRDAPGKLC